MTSGQSHLLKHECVKCRKPDHRQIHCNLVHYMPNRNNLILKCNKSENHERKPLPFLDLMANSG